MKRLLLLISILCLSSSGFSQQPPHPRLNYYHCDMTAGPDDIIRITLKSQLTVYLYDDDTFRKYKDGEPVQIPGRIVTASPYILVPPKQQHWHVVIDAGSQPIPSSVDVKVFLLKPTKLPVTVN